jgi:hypothetical protein
MPLGKRSDFGDARYAGVEINYAHDVAGAMQVRLISCKQQRQWQHPSSTGKLQASFSNCKITSPDISSSFTDQISML